MLKIISNYYKYRNEENNERLIELCKLYLKCGSVDVDLYQIVSYIFKNYENNNDIVSFADLKENFSNFEFLNESFESENEYKEYLKKVYNDLRIKNIHYICNMYLSELNDVTKREKRINLLEDLMKLELNVDSESYEISEIEDFSLKEIIDKNNSYNVGVNTGVEELDEILKVGVLEGKILTIVAPPGCFKTSFAINMSYNEVINYLNSNVLFISLEIPKEELFMKYIVRHSYSLGYDEVTYLSLKNNVISEEQYLNIEKEFKEKKKSKLYILDNSELNFDNINVLKNIIIDIIDKYSIKSIYLDYIQLIMDMKPKNYNDSREWGNSVVGLLRQISVTKNCRIILLSQANSEGINRAERNGGKFSLTNISELNTLKNHSYYIVTLYADDELKVSSQFKWQIIKFRDGETKVEPSLSYVYPNYYALGNKNSYINFKQLIEKKKDNIDTKLEFFEDV